ncbi:MAG TPA: low affinity iron permease family protein [Sphingomicrobium sp.]|nr:low affinity iron permease family protein [Sphingomicrobium sp.]
MQKFFSSVASKTATWMGRPSAFVGATLACVVWAASGPVFNYSDTWQLVINTATTVLTFLAVFLIQNSQNRDGAAIQAKLDELLRALSTARTQFIGIEHLTESQIELIRRALERHAEAEKKALAKKKPATGKKARSTKRKDPAPASGKTSEDTVDRLLNRF